MQNKSGVLTMDRNPGKATVNFRNGSIVQVFDTRADIEDRIGNIMVKSGLINEEKLTEALARQKETKDKLGDVLVKMEVVDRETLGNMLRVQALQVLYKLFKVEDGRYRFDPVDPAEFEQDIFLPIPVEHTLMEGMKIMDEWPKVSKRISSFGLVFTALKKLQEEELQKLDSQERFVYTYVDGSNSVQDIIYITRLAEFDVCKALYNLLEKSVIEEDTGKSQVIVLDVAFVNPFLKAAIKEIESNTTVKVTAGKPQLKEPLEPARGDISGIVGLTGQKKGSFALTFTRDFIVKVVSDMYKVEAKFEDLRVRNSVSSITGRIVAKAMERLAEKGHFFHPSLPTTIIGERHYLEHNTDGPCVVIPFESNAGPFFAEISLEK
jgi:chemotaxis protein CheX